MMVSGRGAGSVVAPSLLPDSPGRSWIRPSLRPRKQPTLTLDEALARAQEYNPAYRRSAQQPGAEATGAAPGLGGIPPVR